MQSELPLSFNHIPDTKIPLAGFRSSLSSKLKAASFGLSVPSNLDHDFLYGPWISREPPAFTPRNFSPNSSSFS